MNEETAMDSTKARTIRKFNPGTFQSDEEVIRQFVVRQPELEIVLDVLHGNVETPACQHVLIVAPRGRGKTMLLTRVAAELRTDNELSRCMLPVRFMEESHEVFDIADFWLETLFYLSKEIVRTDPDLSRELQATHADLAGQWRGEFLADRAKATVLDASDRLGRKLVLMIENMQTLSDDVDDDFGWQLRETLQTEPQIILLGTATSRFERLDDVREPFFELFRILDLKPLDTDACRRLWQVVSGDEISIHGIRPLQILTGGNPRLLVIVAEFSRHRSLRKLMEELVSLVDEHTEYFRGHLEVLAPTERRVYLAAIDLWQPSSTSEIATRARMDVRSVSSLLGRLIDRGAIIVHGTGRKRMYAAAERLYSIYYKLRRERDKASIVHYLIRFMTVFYDEEELVKLTDTFQTEAVQIPFIEEGLKRAREDLPQFGHVVSHSNPSIAELKTTFNKTSKSPEAIQTSLQQKLDVSVLFAKGNIEFLSGDHDAAISSFCSIVEQFKHSQVSEIQLLVAIAMGATGFLHDSNGRFDSALESYEDLVDRFGSSTEPRLKVIVAACLVNKSTTQSHQGDLEAAIDTLILVIKQYETVNITQIREVVAKAMLTLGTFKGQLGERVDEIESYDEIINRFGSDSQDEVQVFVAEAMTNKGVVLGECGKFNEAIAACDAVVGRYGGTRKPELMVSVVRAKLNLGNIHMQQGELQNAIDTFDRMVEEYGKVESQKVQIYITRALIVKAFSYTELGNSGHALSVCDEAERRIRDIGKAQKNEELAIAWAKVMALIVHSQEQDALESFNSIYHDFDPVNEDALSMMQSGVPDMITFGVSERVVLEVLNSDERKAQAISPLIVALKMRLGEKVRAPSEVVEVAEDIIRKVDEKSKIRKSDP